VVRFGQHLLGATVVFAGTLGLSAIANAQQDYMTCDNAHAPDYPFVWAHPRGCDLGLSQSYFQAQPVPGRPFAALGLRHMHWKHWGSYQATAHGLGCNVRYNGSVFRRSCVHVRVDVYHPVRVGPAGFTPIYQRVRVLHRRTRAEPFYNVFWFRPGTDY
jgi:hypothetical protein